MSILRISKASRYVKDGDLNQLAEHLSKRPNEVNERDGFGLTPLHYAATRYHVAIGKLLIDRGATVDSKTKDGKTPLHSAAGEGQVEMASLLIDSGANLNSEDDIGWTPLHCAVGWGKFHTSKLLVERGANIDSKNKEGQTALDIALDYSHDDIDVKKGRSKISSFLRDAMDSKSKSLNVKANVSQLKQGSKDIKFHCFLSHNWGNRQADGSYDNHERVRRIFNGLQRRNVSCWFDSERMTGSINKQMSKGIEDSDCVIVFITESYIAKVNGDNAGDNCKLEFDYAAQTKTKKLMIGVVLDANSRDTRLWTGPFGFILRGELFVDFVNDNDFDKNLSNLCDEISKRINLSPQSVTLPLDKLSIKSNKVSVDSDDDDF